MKEFILNNGVSVPAYGLGVFQMHNSAQCEESIKQAISLGYRMIDTATVYRNEREVGNAIRQCGVPREELFITTKLWFSSCGYRRAKKAFNESLKKLQLDYVDLYLIHQPFGDIEGSWKAMEEAYREGKIRAIGVSNFTIKDLQRIMKSGTIAPMVNQIELNPFYQREEEVAFMKENHIVPESWASFAEGKNGIFKNEILTAIAKKHGATVGQVILSWLNHRGVIVIPKSVHKERIEENQKFLSFPLDEEDMQKIQTLDTHTSQFSWDSDWRKAVRNVLAYMHIG